MATLTGQTIASSYEQLLSLPDGGGDTTTLVAVTDGDAGTTFALKVATTSISVGATNRIYLDGGGNTYLYESAADEVTLACGGELIRMADATGTGENTIYGIGAGLNLDSASDANVFIGANVADAALSGADNNVGVGYNALSGLTTGDDNIAIGYGASQLLTTGGENIAIGSYAFDAADGAETNNISIGKAAFGNISHDSVQRNMAIGDYAGDGMGAYAHVDNLFIGYDSGGGVFSAISTKNLAMGNYSMDGTNAGGNSNVAIGYGTLSANMTSAADNNVAIGVSAGAAITSGDSNTIVGSGAGAAMTDNDANVIIGKGAFAAANTGENGSVVIGYLAGASIDDEDTDNNVIIGQQAGTGGSGYLANCVAIGSSTMDATAGNNQTGVVAVGAGALGGLTSGTSNVAVGYQAADSVTTGAGNTIVGHISLSTANGAAENNTTLGHGAMQSASSSTTTGNIAIGPSALTGGSGALTGCIAIGQASLDSTGSNAQTGTIAIGHSALTALTTGVGNTAVGYTALLGHTTGGYNTAIGYQAMDGTAGDADAAPASVHNVAIGVAALGGDWVDDAASNYNVAIGSYALDAALDGALSNTALGIAALTDLTTGGYNTSIGMESLYENVDGSNNVAVGYRAGETDDAGTDATSPDQCIIIGVEADFDTTTPTNEIVIGYDANGKGDNTATIGNAACTAVYAADDGGAVVSAGGMGIGLGTTAASFPLEVVNAGFDQISCKSTSASHGGNIKFVTPTGQASSMGVYSASAAVADSMFFYHNAAARMLIDTSGAVTMPTHPAFLATPSTGQADIAEDSEVTVVFGTEVFDQGADFASNTFTAPVTGRYQLNMILRLDNMDTAPEYLQVGIRTSNRYYRSIIDPGVLASDPVFWQFTVSVLADMDASDTAFVFVYLQAAGVVQPDIDTSDTYFSGYLAC